ncbi:hypothetical protein AAE478_007018 [Parahypoxylon ruwenzoriense]
MKSKPLWLLVSDVHFKSNDLDRIIRTANWIASIPNTYNVSRAIICGDLLTARTSQLTHVLSACYRFLNRLVGAVPHVNIILGNHDLAYRLDYKTSALEALAIDRLAPFVTLHTEVGCHEWDGRRVFVMPFREDQSQIIKSIHDLDPESAAMTVGFGHLAINRAITQKHIINPETGKAGSPVRYPGFTGAADFAPLARTFTGHFHNHQTIFQAASLQSRHPRGSITYIGSPLQLTWADLFDTRKGAILLNPETLETEFVDNPNAVGYMTVEVQDVLADQVHAEQVHSKHVMITGKLSRYKYISARDRLVKLGVRSVRDWKPFEPEWQQSEEKGLGKTMLPVDVQHQLEQNGQKAREEAEKTQLSDIAKSLAISSPDPTAGKIEREPIDLGGIVKEYVSSLNLGSILEGKQEILTVVGQRLVNMSSCVHGKTDCTVKYSDMLDLSTPLTLTPSHDALHTSTAQSIFAAHPVAVEITNFLGVQGTLKLDFKHHFQPGMNIMVGHNGAGKSTIIEAIVWCQFGQCIRDGLGVNDVVNDVVGKNCNVRLTFANGYTISRFRKHGEFQNRVVVEKKGIIQSQFEGPNVKSTQAYINGLLGVDFDTFVRTILLGNESARSFLSASSLQRRQLIETTLGLGILDGCTEACNSMLSQVDEELSGKQSRLNEITHTITLLKSRFNKQMEQRLRYLRNEVSSLTNKLQREEKKHITSLRRKGFRINELRENLTAENLLPDLEPELLNLQMDVSRAQSEVGKLGALAKLAQARLSIDREGADIKQGIAAIITRLHYVEEELKRLLEENDTLEIPTPLTEDDRDNETKETSSRQGFLLGVALAFRKLWTSILVVISPKVREKFNMARQAALKLMESQRRWHEHIKAINTLTNKATKTQGHIVNVENRVANFSQDIAIRNSMSKSDIHTALQTLTVQEALDTPGRLTVAIDELQALTNRYGHLKHEYESRKQRKLRKEQDLKEYEKEMETERGSWETSLDRYNLMVTSVEREIATCKAHIESDAELLNNLSHQAIGLRQECAILHSHREIFAFWQSSFTQRRVAASKPTFRRYVMQRHLGELNKLLGQILMVMYNDTHYAHSVTVGTIGALFEGDGEDDDDNNNIDPKSTSVLDPSLSINPALEYAKKSSGERKRVDLALFFTIFMMGEARSAHMARYMLVDEAFDNLDSTGQTSVLNWCRWMIERLEYVFVITHSSTLINLAEKAAGADGAGANIVTVKAGSKGTELVVNGDR